MNLISAIESRYYSIAQQLGASSIHIHFATSPQHDGSPHVESEGRGYCYVVTERGCEYERKRTNDPEKVLYWLISDLTFAMAGDYELAHRIPGQDSRCLRFKKDLELLAKVNSDWSHAKQLEYEHILQQFPYDDNIG